MLSPILRFSIQHRMLIILLTILVAAVGMWSLTQLPIDAVPDITNVQVQINTEVPALPPQDIERQVTWPIETAMAGIPGLEYTRSLSRNGFSQVTVVFEEGTDIFFARQQVTERLSQVRQALPVGAEPATGPISTGLGEVVMYTVAFKHPHGKGLEPVDGAPGWQRDGSYLSPEGQRLSTDIELASYLRTVQDWIIAPQLKNVLGVAGVDSIGGYEKQYQVSPDPLKLLAFDLTFSDVVEALEGNNQSVGAQFIERSGESYVVRADGRVRSPDDIGSIVLKVRGGTPIHIHDVATVGIGKELRTGSASREGEEAVVGTVMMLLGGNSRTVAAASSERLAQVEKSLPPDVFAGIVLNRQKLVDATISTVRTNLIEGAILVIVILFLLLGNFRGALIAALAIPLSMLFAAIGMQYYGMSGNLMSLGAIDFGIIVDTAVIIVENSLRLLAERQHKLGRTLSLRERLHEVFEATKQMIQPAVFGQAIIITVYVPILMLSGIEGKMFRPMGATVIFALIGAFIISLTFVPAMVAMLVSGKVKEGENWIMRWAKRGYTPVVTRVLPLRWLVASVAVILLVISAWLFTRLGQEFIPTLDEGDIAMHAMRIPSTGISQSTAMQLQVEKAVMTIPEVQVVFSKTGTAEAATDPMPPNVSDTFVIFKPRAEWPDKGLDKDALVDRLNQVLKAVPGNNYEFTQPIQMRFNELIAGVRSDIAVKVFGDRFEDLLPTANAIAAVLNKIPGSASVKVEQVSGLPALSVGINRDVIARLGLNIRDVQEVIATAVGGREAGVVFEGDRRFDIIVRLPEDQRSDLATLKQLPIPMPVDEDPDADERAQERDAPEPRFVPLGDVADLTIEEGLNQISRENGKRRVVVQTNVRGRDLGSFVNEAQLAIDSKVALPAGTWLDWGGQFENLQEAKARLTIVVPVCFLVIFLLLFSTFNSVKYATLVFTGVPLALTGGIVALWLRDMPFSISAAVGFIALSGVAVLNGLVMVSYINHLRKEGTLLEDAIMIGSLTRLRPVLMTALVASLGFVPMALATGKGAEVQKPLATVVIGGIISSTLLTLVVLPALYRLWHRKNAAFNGDEDDDGDQNHLDHPTTVVVE